jgi:hypothetical protein
MRVLLFGGSEDLDVVVHGSLHPMGLAFFRALNDEHGTDELIGGGNV